MRDPVYAYDYFKLGNNISVLSSWTPISVSWWFVLDGDGFTISGLRNSLFGTASSLTVKNLNLTSVNINTSGDHVGAIIGDGTHVDIRNCTASGTVKSDGNYVGGLVGRSNNGSSYVYRSTFSGTVQGTHYVGGIAGQIYDYGTVFYQCASSGSVTAIGSSSISLDGTGAGGLVGYLRGYAEQCYSTASITGGDAVGGLVGRLSPTSSYSCYVNDSYARGSVTGNGNKVGGLVGDMQYTTGTSEINHSYATGSVQGNGYVGGLVGYTGTKSTIYECFANNSEVTHSSGTYVGRVGGNTSGSYVYCIARKSMTIAKTVTPSYSSRDGEDATLAELQYVETLYLWNGFNLTNRWIMSSDVSPYPTLRWQTENSPRVIRHNLTDQQIIKGDRINFEIEYLPVNAVVTWSVSDPKAARIISFSSAGGVAAATIEGTGGAHVTVTATITAPQQAPIIISCVVTVCAPKITSVSVTGNLYTAETYRWDWYPVAPSALGGIDATWLWDVRDPTNTMAGSGASPMSPANANPYIIMATQVLDMSTMTMVNPTFRLRVILSHPDSRINGLEETLLLAYPFVPAH